MLKCVLLIRFYGFVLSKVIFSFNFLFFLFFPPLISFPISRPFDFDCETKFVGPLLGAGVLKIFTLLCHWLQGMRLWTSKYAIKVCHHGLQGMPSWTSMYAILDFKVCYYRLQGMLSCTLRYAIMDFLLSIFSSRVYATRKLQ